jgi:hypothetical protein
MATAFLKRALSVYDVESKVSYVEIVYDRYIKKGKCYETYVDYISTEPSGDWQQIKSHKRTISYVKFLDTMVKKTVEVQQKIAELTLENFLLSDYETNTYVRVAHSSKILDPTFQPPIINMNSAWQVDVIKKFCKKHLQDVIQECTDLSRLEYFSSVLNIIQSGV